MPIEEIIIKYRMRLINTINPSGVSIEEMEHEYGVKFDSNEAVNDFLRHEEEYDEGEQVRIMVYDEILEDLTKLQEELND